jgi:signal transduction histidine kinase
MRKKLLFLAFDSRHAVILRKILLLISFACSVCYGLAQNKFIDSVRNELYKAKDDTTKVFCLSFLGYYWRFTNLDSSMWYSNAALSFAQQLKYARGEADALTNLGTAFREKGEFPQALKTQLTALEIARKNGCIREESIALRRIGMIYMDLSDAAGTMEYYGKALYEHKQNGFNKEATYDYLVMATAYVERKIYDSARNFIQKAGEKLALIPDVEPEFYLWRGSTFWLKRNKDSALADWRKGYRLGLNYHYNRTVSRIYLAIGTMFNEINQYDSGIIYGKQALEFAKKASNGRAIYESSQLLFELNDTLKRPAEALAYLKIASAAKDSLFGEGNIKTIQQIIANENAKQIEIQTERATYQSRLRQTVLAFGMGAILVIAIILYLNNRKKQKTNITLAKQKAEIQETLAQLKSTQAQLVHSEKMASLGELTAGVAHEIQNPLNFVNNFSELNEELIDEMDKALGESDIETARNISNFIRQNLEKTVQHGKRADAIVKGMLQHSRTGIGQREATDINALANEFLWLSYKGLKAKDQDFTASIRTEFDNQIGMVNIVPQDISRVLVNLYSNAFYALREKTKQSLNGYEPTVIVTTRKAKGILEITVKDNGNGIPENIRQKIFQPFFTTKPTGQGTGLGLSLSYDIIKAHGGEIRVKSEIDEGSEFTIILPMNS